jgi:hypothetical protein
VYRILNFTFIGELFLIVGYICFGVCQSQKPAVKEDEVTGNWYQCNVADCCVLLGSRLEGVPDTHFIN